MRAVIQRVARASVEVDGQIVGQIRDGLLVLLGVADGDTEADGRSLAEKLRTLRIFSDDRGKMNRSLTDTGGSVLLVSQFTLLGNTRNGRRPSFEAAAAPTEAKRLYEFVIGELRERGVPVETGVFAAHMAVDSVNDGPVTFVLETR
ncbi:MAG: D-tyr-tRNA(Tyr) deacylase [Nitrospira sp.]